MCCSSPPPPPDYSALAASSVEAAKISQQIATDNLNWAKEVYANNQKVVDEVLSIQLPMMREAYQNSKDDRERYETVFQPIEDDLIEEFRTYDTEDRRELEAGRSMATTGKAIEASRSNAEQRLQALGVDPSQLRAATETTNAVAEGAALAAAGNQGRQKVIDTGRALRGAAIDIGRGSGNTAQAINAINQTAQTATNAGAQNFQAGSNAMTAPATWMNASTNAVNAGTNTLNTSYNNQMTQYQNTTGFMDIFGGVAGMASSWLLGGGGNPFKKGKDGGIVYAADGTVIEGELMPMKGMPMEGMQGKVISGPGGPRGDKIPAMLSDGEGVIPADVVNWLGRKHILGLTDKARKEMIQHGALPTGVPPPKQALPAQARA